MSYLFSVPLTLQAHYGQVQYAPIDASPYCNSCPYAIDALVLCPLKQEWDGVIQFGPIECIIDFGQVIINVEGKSVLVVLSGVGLSNSCGTFGQLIVHYPFTPLCLIGVAGSANDSVKKGDVVVPQKWTLINNVFYSNDKYFPYATILAYRRLYDGTYQSIISTNQLNELPTIIDIGYGNGFAMSLADVVLSNESRNLLASAAATLGQELLLFDLETAGILSVIQQHNLPLNHFAAIRVISDDKNNNFNINEVTELVKRSYDEFIKWLNYHACS